MPDSRSHRGPHPEDARDFAEQALSALRTATAELSYLLGRDYAENAALKLVGDHHQLTARQRKAVSRAACSDAQRTARTGARRTHEALRGSTLRIDGFNCLIRLEAMLGGAPVFVGRDSATRDLASVHGTYRTVDETEPAVELLVQTLARHEVESARVWLDRPVGNSGRLAQVLTRVFASSSVEGEVVLSDAVDRELVAEPAFIASSDGWVMDRASAWIDLPRLAAADHALTPWLVDLSVC